MLIVTKFRDWILYLPLECAERYSGKRKQSNEGFGSEYEQVHYYFVDIGIFEPFKDEPVPARSGDALQERIQASSSYGTLASDCPHGHTFHTRAKPFFGSLIPV